MAQSDHLRLADLRSAFRLIGECRELGADSRAWRAHMLAGLRDLTGARLALYLHIRDLATEAEQILEPLDSGFIDDAQRALWAHYQQERAHRDDPFHQRYYRTFTGALRTRCLESVVPASEWSRSRHCNEYVRACGLDDRITSSVALSPAPAITQVIVLHRSARDGKFPERMVKLVHLFHDELRPLIGRKLALPGAADDRSRLPPQLACVLGCLLQGDAEKQIASRLGLSPHTVNRHVQRLYRRFGVHSRAELMCRCGDFAGYADRAEPAAAPSGAAGSRV
jgi:hypothetical protein